jgi:hypothetical protein
MTRRFTRIGAVLGAVTLAAALALTMGTRPAHATSFGEISVSYNNSWCITALNDMSPGSELVLGICAGAASQEYAAIFVGGGSAYYELQNEADDLCITNLGGNGQHDGSYAVLGNCAAAANQIFNQQPAYGSGEAWVMPERTDNNGNHLTLDNAGGNTQVNNHIDYSYYGATLPSESWSGPPIG